MTTTTLVNPGRLCVAILLCCSVSAAKAVPAFPGWGTHSDVVGDSADARNLHRLVMEGCLRSHSHVSRLMDLLNTGTDVDVGATLACLQHTLLDLGRLCLRSGASDALARSLSDAGSTLVQRARGVPLHLTRHERDGSPSLDRGELRKYLQVIHDDLELLRHVLGHVAAKAVLETGE